MKKSKKERKSATATKSLLLQQEQLVNKVTAY